MGTSASVMQQEEANLKYAHSNKSNHPPAPAGEPIKAEEKNEFSHGTETEKVRLILVFLAIFSWKGVLFPFSGVLLL